MKKNLNISTIMISVLMPVYNHEKYLAHAIDSVLMQNVDFQYEIIIGEDCSTDKSRDIIMKYWHDNPGIIIPIIHSKNLGANNNVRSMYEIARGKYVAFLEGDDYWTSPYKLQTQIDFLEKHSDYSACYHSVKIIDERDRLRSMKYPEYIYDKDSDYTLHTWMSMPQPGHTSSRVECNMYRIASKDVIDKYWMCGTNGDMKAVLVSLLYGKIRRMGCDMSCWRLSYEGDSWNAHIKRTDRRDELYILSLENERLAIEYFKIKFLPHTAAVYWLQSVLFDNFSNSTRSKTSLLGKMVSYSLYNFLTAIFCIEYQSLWEKERLIVISPGMVADVYRKMFGNKLVIFGMGADGEKCMNVLSVLGLNKYIVEIWDSDPNKQNTKFREYYIRNPNLKYLREEVTVIIASKRYEQDMKKMLYDMGYSMQVEYYTKFVNSMLYHTFCQKYIVT